MSELTRQQILDELYEKIAPKELKFGLQFRSNRKIDKEKGNCCYVGKAQDGCYYVKFKENESAIQRPASELKIIGHEPTLKDVLLKLQEICGVSGFGIHAFVVYLSKSEYLNGLHGKIKTNDFLEVIESIALAKSFDNQPLETLEKLRSLICTDEK